MGTGKKPDHQEDAAGFDRLFWKDLSRKILHSLNVFDIYSIERESSQGKRGEFILLDARDWVTIIPYEEGRGDGAFLMVSQFRHGSGIVTIEFPAGLVDAGESLQETAERELLEETGYKAEEFTHLGSVNPNPAYLNNLCHVFLATKLTPFGEQNLDEHELIDVEWKDRKMVEDSLGKGPYSNAIMLMAMYLFTRWEKST